MANGPITPRIEQLDRLRSLLQDQDIDSTSTEISNQRLDEIDSVLEWVQVFLQNRKDYHTKRNTKMKVELELLKGRLMDNGINPEEIAREAAEAADRKLIND